LGELTALVPRAEVDNQRLPIDRGRRVQHSQNLSSQDIECVWNRTVRREVSPQTVHFRQQCSVQFISQQLVLRSEIHL